MWSKTFGSDLEKNMKLKPISLRRKIEKRQLHYSMTILSSKSEFHTETVSTIIFEYSDDFSSSLITTIFFS